MTSKTIFITGAAAGIGKETALLFARRGWYVGLFDIDEDALRPLAEIIGPDHCCAYPIDVRDIDSVLHALDYFSSQTGGRLNVLFNNAGIIVAGELDDIDLEAQKQLLDINIWGVLNCTQQAMPLLKASEPACVVNMSSASALYGHPSLTAYAASKMAVRSITEGLDIGLAKYGIKVCDLMPFWVNTSLAQNAADAWEGLKMKDVRLGPAQIAENVWKAVHGSRLHWLIGRETHAYNLLARLLPGFALRFFARTILKS